MPETTLSSVEFTDDGFFVHPEEWSESLVPALAAREGLEKLTDRHWQVIRFARRRFLTTAMAPTVRLYGKASGVSIRELYRLFPRSPSGIAARIAGIPKLYLCQNGGFIRTAAAAQGARGNGYPPTDPRRHDKP